MNLRSADAPAYFSERVPWTAPIARHYTDRLQGAASYPFLADVVSALAAALRTRPIAEVETAFGLAEFFACVDAVLEQGDAGARDLLWAKVVEVFGKPSYEYLRPYWGPRFAAQVERYRALSRIRP